MPIAGARIQLTGTNDRAQVIDALFSNTDAAGVYSFFNLRPGNYTLTEQQPTGFDDGSEALGTVNGVPVGDASVNDQFSGIVLGVPASVAENYNFGELPTADGTVAGSSQTAGIGFWQNKNGQALINSLNGGSTSTQLANWLAATFPNLYGANAGDHDLTGKENWQVADFYQTLFHEHGKAGGVPKLDAQVLATALSVYVTNETLAGTTAANYGFTVTTNGLGVRTFNVGDNGAAFGVADGSDVQVIDLLRAVDAQSAGGLLYDLDGDGDTSDHKEQKFRKLANEVFTGLNEAGDLRS